MATTSQLLTSERAQPLAIFYDAIVRTHVWVAAGVTALSLFACVRLELAATPTTLGIPFLSTLLIYNVDTALDLKRANAAARRGNPVHAGHAGAMQARASKLAAVALVLLVLAFASAHWQTAVVVTLGAGFGCLYAVPFGKRRLRLKAVPGIKSLFVGGAVALAVVSVPLVENAARVSLETWTTLACIFTVTFINATLFDIRDVAQDSARGLATLPVLMGVGRLRLGLLLFLIANFWLVGWCDPSLREHAVVLAMGLTPLILALGPASPKYAYSWLVDGALWIPWLLTLGPAS